MRKIWAMFRIPFCPMTCFPLSWTFSSAHRVEWALKPGSLNAIYTLLWWEWFGFIFHCASSTESWSVLFLVQTDFNLHLWCIVCLQLASSPGITSPFLGHQGYPFHVCLVRKIWFSVSKAPVPGPPSLTPHCSFWPSGWLGRQLLDLSWAVPTHTLFLLIEKKIAY